MLRLCGKAGLVKLGHVAFDGSKVAANASKHKAMSYKRMEEERRLAAEVEALLAKANETDSREDAQYGVGKAPEDLPEERGGASRGGAGSVRRRRRSRRKPPRRGPRNCARRRETRAQALSKKRRTEIAKAAARVRWGSGKK